LETIDLKISEENTTWFDDDSDDHDIYIITDLDGGLSISPGGYDYPLLKSSILTIYFTNI
jgi:hypothetical protein